MRAYAILAAACRATSQVAEADATYEKALRLSAGEDVAPSARALLYLQVAVLRAWQKRFEESLQLVDQATEIYEPADDFLGMGMALSTRGYVYNESFRFSEAIPNHGRALKLLNPKSNSQANRTYHATIHNLAYAVSQTSSSKDLGAARSYIRASRSRLRQHRQSLPKHKLSWVEGLLLIQVGLTRRGEKLLDNARDGFLTLKAPYEIALVGLDLSALYHLEGRWDDLKTLAKETFRRFRELSADTEAIASLSLWNDAVMAKTLSDQLILTARKTIERRMRYGVLA